MNCTSINDSFSLDSFDKIANIIIAIFTLLFSIYIFYITNKKEKEKNSKDRKTDSLKTIILEHNLKNLFSFYENVIIIMQPISERKHTDDEKEDINDNLQNTLKKLRLEFTDLFLAVDKKLYDCIKDSTDLLIDDLTIKMFDDGINLSHKPKFEEEITASISKSKTETVKHLYEFNS
ncbi:hypothetical protein [Tenacibaculum soleae]|uniref:hypothetical protein n=1 Tax=Tenacibaculum soleae TaxID=447689 RepID=UPI002300738D|nr:hypothetical protein [Tenacibaculum soleae]